MSALIYILLDDQVVLVMDTLSSYYTETGLKPYKFVSKIFPLTHMNSVLCGTGNYQPILKWFEYIEINFVAYGIKQLNRLSSERIKPFMEAENPTNEPTTIYQFGIDEVEGSFKGYAYRSTNNYSSEMLIHSVGVKPQDAFNSEKDIADYFKEKIDDEVLSLLMLKMKEYDDDLDDKNPKKVGIGGQMEICNMQKNSLQIVRKDIFPDCASVYKEILAGCSK